MPIPFRFGKAPVVACLLVAGWVQAAPEASGTKVAYRVFSGSTQTHRVLADKFFLVRGMPLRLENIEIQFLDPQASDKVLQRIHAKEAFYDRAAERVTGDAEIRLFSDELTARGFGFELDLKTSELDIRRDFSASHALADVVSDSARIMISSGRIPVETGDRLARVHRFEAVGNVRVANKEKGKRWFDEAFMDSLIFDGPTGNLSSPGRVRGMLNGQESSLDNFVYPLRRERVP